MQNLISVRSRLVGSLLCGAVLLGGTAWAGTSALEGTVRDANGRPIKGADVKIEAKGSQWNTAVKSDAKGHYVSGGLPAGNYKVTLMVAGSVKASINNAAVKNGNSTQLNFDLKTSAASSAKKGKHMVWVPAQTGSHIGGRWVEVDGDDGAAMGHVDSADATAVRRMVQPNAREGGGR